MGVSVFERNNCIEFLYDVLHDRGIRGFVDGNARRRVGAVHRAQPLVYTDPGKNILYFGGNIDEFYIITGAKIEIFSSHKHPPAGLLNFPAF